MGFVPQILPKSRLRNLSTNHCTITSLTMITVEKNLYVRIYMKYGTYVFKVNGGFVCAFLIRKVNVCYCRNKRRMFYLLNISQQIYLRHVDICPFFLFLNVLMLLFIIFVILQFPEIKYRFRYSTGLLKKPPRAIKCDFDPQVLLLCCLCAECPNIRPTKPNIKNSASVVEKSKGRIWRTCITS